MNLHKFARVETSAIQITLHWLIRVVTKHKLLLFLHDHLRHRRSRRLGRRGLFE